MSVRLKLGHLGNLTTKGLHQFVGIILIIIIIIIIKLYSLIYAILSYIIIILLLHCISLEDQGNPDVIVSQ